MILTHLTKCQTSVLQCPESAKEIDALVEFRRQYWYKPSIRLKRHSVAEFCNLSTMNIRDLTGLVQATGV